MYQWTHTLPERLSHSTPFTNTYHTLKDVQLVSHSSISKLGGQSDNMTLHNGGLFLP